MRSSWSVSGTRVRVVLLIVALAAACSGPAANPRVENHTATPAGTPFERAQAYERGAGVHRDYRAAADGYRAACDDGRGDVLACGALIRAALRSRGVDFDRATLRALTTKVCVDRRDPFSCVAADLLSGRESGIPPPVMAVIKDVLDHMPECDAAQPSACEARLLADGLDFSDSTGAQHRRSELHLQFCRAGLVEGCGAAIHSGHLTETETTDVHGRLTSACDAGDADACMASPERTPIPPGELCAAGDYEACGALGCRGDARAAALAASHGVPGGDDCARLLREHERDSAP